MLPALSARMYEFDRFLFMLWLTIALDNALAFLLDDLFIDTPDSFLLDQYGINRSACETPEAMLLYLDTLDADFTTLLYRNVGRDKGCWFRSN
jgi:hypothetical protein